MLRLDAATKRYGKAVAVDALSFEVGAGEVFGLLGPNGAGKSTTIALATGLLLPDAGVVTVGEAGPPSERAVRRHLGVCPQSIALYEDLTAGENLVLFAGVQGMRTSDARERSAVLLERVGLLDRARKRVKTFSGGMKRRLNLAAALVHDPKLVLLDEPTAGVDPHSRAAIFELVEELKAEGKAVVYTTHYMEEAQRLCDRVGVIDHGRLLALGTVDELIESHGGASVVTLETDQGEERIETDTPLEVVASRANGGGVLGLRVQRPGLESVFLNLTGRSLRDG